MHTKGAKEGRDQVHKGLKYPYHAQAQSLPVTAYSHCAVVFLDVEKQTLMGKYLVSTA